MWDNINILFDFRSGYEGKTKGRRNIFLTVNVLTLT